MVSVIIPLFNVESFVKNSLNSALNQTFQDIEFILVDDCCTDNTMRIVNELVKDSKRKDQIKIISHEFNQGLSAARNTGMCNSEGEYVFFMDSDDEIPLDCIELHYNAIIKSNADFTIANIKLEGSNSLHVKFIENNVSDLLPLDSFLARKWLCSACNKLFKRSFIVNNKFKFQNGIIFEDILWSFDISIKSNRLQVVQERTYIYKIRKDSITTKKINSKKIESKIFIVRAMLSKWPSNTYKLYQEKLFSKFIEFENFNTALLLLNYDGSYGDKIFFYKQIQLLNRGCRGVYSCFIKLPFVLFSVVFGPVYFLYKKIF